MIIPSEFRSGLPDMLRVVDEPPTPEEQAYATEMRRQFLVRGEAMPYMTDIIRAFRLARGAKRYVEVGSRDRGNIAWVFHHLANAPTIIDIDIEHAPECEVRLLQFLAKRANYTLLHGNSVDPELVRQVKEKLGPESADVIFCDSSHMYEHTIAEFAMYWPLVRDGGVLMYHDAFWEGNTVDKGKYQALVAIDRFVPVWCVALDEPIHRITARSTKGDVWGGVAIIPKLLTGIHR